ncbi:MAG: dinitrogenase iron-molybdenum cofactor biosynthesis protein [Proteobacteria bacterium]|nr:dinitrogenase iron-molybdenum cofactor biosynthesis protein [Pseudomonadota bacterium]
MLSKRVAISVKSMDGLDSQIDPRFGRAYAFLIVELTSGKIATQFFNSAASAAHGAGTAATVAMKNNDVDAVISGRFGPKAYEALSLLGIEMWLAPDNTTVREALDMFSLGTLEQMKLKVY